MVLNSDILDSLDVAGQFAQESRTADTSHILQTDFVTTSINQLLSHLRIVLNGMDRRISDAKTTLRNHATSMSISDRRDDVTRIVQTTERTSDISTLFFLYYIEQLADIGRDWAHTESVQCTVQHVGLDARLVEWLRPLTNSLIWILSIEEINLFETTTIGFYSVEATHLNDCRSYFCQLVNARYILTCSLPHISENETEFYFFSHF